MIKYLYHYSKQPHPDIRSNALQFREKKDSHAEKDHVTVSLFMSPLSKKSIKAQIDAGSVIWDKRTWYEHVVSFDDLLDSCSDTMASLRSSFIEVDYDDKNWPDENSNDYYEIISRPEFRSKYKKDKLRYLKDQRLVDVPLLDLIAHPRFDDIVKSTEKYFNDTDNDWYNPKQYASITPHLIVEPKKPIMVKTVNSIRVL